MELIGNIIWFVFAGLWSGLAWIAVGICWCITLIGIPIGLQCFKFAALSFWPFGKRVVNNGGAGSFIINVIWFFLGGFEMALANFLAGCIFCITIIGIPFGLQLFKIAKLALMPVGSEIVEDGIL